MEKIVSAGQEDEHDGTDRAPGRGPNADAKKSNLLPAGTRSDAQTETKLQPAKTSNDRLQELFEIRNEQAPEQVEGEPQNVSGGGHQAPNVLRGRFAKQQQTAIERFEEQQAKLLAVISDQQQEIQHHRTQVTELSGKISGLESSLDESAVSRRELEERLVDQENAIKRLLGGDEGSKSQGAEQRGDSPAGQGGESGAPECGESTPAGTEIPSQIIEKSPEHSALEQELSTYKTEINNAQHALRATSLRCRALTAENLVLRERGRGLLSEFRTLSDELARASAHTTEKAVVHEATLERLRSTQARLETALGEAHCLMAELSAVDRDVLGALQSMQERLENSSEQRRQQEIALDQARSEIEHLEVKREEDRQAAHQLRGQLESALNQLQLQERVLAEAQQRLGILSSDVGALLVECGLACEDVLNAVRRQDAELAFVPWRLVRTYWKVRGLFKSHFVPSRLRSPRQF